MEPHPPQLWLLSLQRAGADGNRTLGTKSTLSYPERHAVMDPESNPHKHHYHGQSRRSRRGLLLKGSFSNNVHAHSDPLNQNF